jgi:phosphoglycerate dehydrogenase-like enzyme
MTPHLSGWTAEQEVRKTEQMAANLEAVALGCTPRFLLRR